MIITVLITGGLIALAALGGAAVWLLLRRDDGYQPGHKTPRPWARSAAGAARAGRRLLAGRRLPGALRRRLARDLGTEDRITLGLMQRMRGEDTGGLMARQAPTRGDAQGRAVRVRAPESRPAARADLTGSLSPRTDEEGSRAASAPPPGWHHDEYAPAQRWHPGPAELVPLPPVTGPALAVLAAITAPVRAHLDAAEQARAQAFQAEAMTVFPPWQEWPSDDTIDRGMRAVQ